MDKEKLDKMARATGRDTVKYLRKYKEYDVYIPIQILKDGERPSILGTPPLILCNGDEARFANKKEAEEIYKTL